MPSNQSSLLKIGVFYDGSFFQHVSNYYYFNHPRRSRIRISGLHDFIRELTAEEEGREVRLCQIVDSHLFKGRLYAGEATENQIYYDRVFDDILMSEGVVTHYLPLRSSWSGKKMEKGIDVWLALEAYELCVKKEFDVVVLIASDGDYAPLIRKINALGSRMMVLSWEFDFTNEEGNTIYTRTSHELLDEASYPVAMHKIIDGSSGRYIGLINNIFVQSQPRNEPRIHLPADEPAETNAAELTTGSSDNDAAGDDDLIAAEKIEEAITSEQPAGRTMALVPRVVRRRPTVAEPVPEQTLANFSPEDIKISYVLSLKNGYGFIKYPPNNLFFHFSKLIGTDFNSLFVGDKVEFRISQNDHGEDIAVDVRLIAHSDDLQSF